ncbi:MAG: HEAT repeat domain-containing protein, partial [Sandaracinaceae bacterium]|nr:HEAT repeat domain-containing protein [Sandaracinaceae bacterium]
KVRAAAVLRAAEVATTATESSTRDEAYRLVENAALDGGDDPDGSLRVRLAAARALASDPRKEAKGPLETLLLSPEPPRKIVPVTPSWGGGGWGGPPWGVPVQPAPPPKPPKPASPDLVRFVRETAAMALGARGDHELLLLKARARDNVEASRAALLALAAYPPPTLSAIVPKGEGIWPRESLDLLVRLGDPRGAEPLLKACAGNDDLTAAIALVGLSRLGDGRAVPVARAVTKDSRPELRVAAAEALAELGESYAEAAILALLADEKTTSEGKRLALRHPSTGLVPDLEKLARAGDPAAIGALGRAGALSSLAGIARDDALPAGIADVAAHQLAIAALDGGKALAEVLDGASPARRRRAIRAGAVYAARHGGSAPSGHASVAKSLAASSAPEDKAAGTLFLYTVDLGRAEAALAREDLLLRRAGVAGLGAHAIADAARLARAHLEAHGTTEPDDLVQALAAVAARAVDGSVAHDVPVSTVVLSRWLSEDGPAAPLAAYLLAARGGELARAHVARALASDGLDVRVGALLGLALSPDESAIGELASRLVDSPSPLLRRAAMRALSARGDTASVSAITTARRLDADAEVRALAAHVHAGITSSPLLSGREVAQAKVGLGKGMTATATFAAVDGLVLPTLVDPEGFVVAFRVASGPVRLDVRPLVPTAPPGKAPAP